MPSCREVDSLVTPYVDGVATADQRAMVDAHLAACPPCRQRAEAQFEHSHGWQLRLPAASPAAGLQLVGVRQCFCGEGPAVHVMYRHDGRPLSLYVLHDITRTRASAEVFGHDALIWSKAGNTY